jgi:hypothetical protein
VRGGEAGADVAGDAESLVLRQTADPLQQRAEVLALDELHDDEVMRSDFGDVVETANVRMRDAAAEPDFRDQPGHALRIVLELRREKLQSHALADFQIVGAIDDPHPAAPDRSREPVPPEEERSGRELRHSLAEARAEIEGRRFLNGHLPPVSS